MFFCKSCSKLLDDDLKICPYCGASEDEPQEAVMQEGEPKKTEINKAPVPDFSNLEEKSIFASDKTDEKINEINEMIEKKQQDISDFVPHPPQLAEVKPPVDAPTGDEDVSTGIKVGLVLLAIFVPIAGIIFGAIYMGKSNPKQKSFGKIILIISIVLTALSFICCCSLFVLGTLQAQNYSFY